MKIEYWPLEKIIPYGQNAKNHHVDWIKESIKDFKPDQPIVVDSAGVIIKGHGRLKAAKSLGMTEFPVVVRDDLTPEQVRIARIVDNRSAEGGWINEILEKELSDIGAGGLEQYGIDENWFDELGITPYLNDDDAGTLDNDADAIPENVESICKQGDMWRLGDHLLLCGDCTDTGNVERLMQLETAELLFTSPPYADMRDYGGCDLSIDKLKKFISVFYPFARYQVVNLGLKRKDHEIVEYWQEYIQEAKSVGYKFLSWNVWNRDSASSIGSQTAFFPIWHEFIFVFGYDDKEINRTRKNKTPGSKSGTNRKKDGTTTYGYGVTKKFGKIGSVQNIGVANGKLHPAMFPIELPLEYIKAMTSENDIIAEPFGGSGTTLIACEKTNRHCRMIEIDEKYCTIILKRYLQYTGKYGKVFLSTNDKEAIPYEEVLKMRGIKD